jgi:23S rRNA (uracil1939-C5)-methyltransferase
VAQATRTGVTPVVGDHRVALEVAGAHFRVTGTNFFQVNREGAAALVRLVAGALDPGPDDTLLDAYAGVGLFAATVGTAAGRVLAVESGRSSTEDLVHNLGQAGIDAAVARGRVERILRESGEAWDLAVCDPPRRGLGAEGVAAIVAGGPRAIAYVSCDPAALARDTRLLADTGYRFERATPVDLFPQTYHVEAVALFSRASQ